VVDLVNGNPIPGGGVFFDGLGGSDTAVLVGTGGDDSAILNGANVVVGAGTIATTNTEAFRFEAGAGSDLLDFQSGTLTPTFIGDDGQNLLTVTSGTWTYNVDAATQNELIDIDVFGGSSINFNTSQHLNSLRLRAGVLGTLSAGASKLIRTGQLTLAATSRLNLNDGGLIVDYTGGSPLSTITGQLTTGYASGAWNGNGINSAFAAASGLSDALGYAEASELFGAFPATFLGEDVDNSTVLVRYTLSGDANLDGTANIGDFSRVAASFNLAGGWSNGNFNYDILVDIADFSLLAANFNQSIPAALPRAASASVPTGETRSVFGARRIGSSDDQKEFSLVGDVL
jgi:hypothetical protein